MKSVVWAAVVALSLAVAPSASASFWDAFGTVEYEGHRTWFLQISGGATLQQLNGDTRFGGSADTDLDFDDTLGIDDDRTYWTRIDFQPFLRHHLRFTYTPFRFKGKRDLDPGEGLSVNGQGFSLGTVKSDIQLETYDFAYRWDAMYIGERVTLSPILGVSLLDGSGEIKHETGGVVDVDESESFFVPVPQVGLRLEGFPFARLGFFGEAKGMTIGKKGTTFDAEGGMELFLMHNVSFQARYRFAAYEIDIADVQFDADLSGPYIGMAFRF